MSELNSRGVDDVYIEYYNTGKHELAQVYLKSEADKVIAELKKERNWLAKDRAQAYNDLEKRAQLNIKQEESIRHQKYKRCLAMAKWCASRSASWCLDPADDELHKSDFYDKWKKRWLELAEKFKEAK